jgi:hypothetical protein
MKQTKLTSLVALMVGLGLLQASVGDANADTIVQFSATGTFSSPTSPVFTLTGTMEVDITTGCIIGTAPCPDGGTSAPSAPHFTVFSAGAVYPLAGETFILGANPLAPDFSLPLISNPFCCGDMSMTVTYSGAADLIGYAGGPITGGQLFNNGTNIIASGLTGSFTAVTPLPAALPLFATGLAGLGLLGWRRKRKVLA